MHLHPLLIGTSKGIINLSAVVSVHPAIPMWLQQENATFGIAVITTSDESMFCLCDDEARLFLRKLGSIDWIPGTGSWAYPEQQEEGND